MPGLRERGARGRLVVTGDDFGSEPAANQAIAAAFDHGILTHASLMVTAAAREDAVARARARPELSVGLHLVLSDGTAASPPVDIPDLVDPSGRFPDDPARAGWRIWRRRRRVRDQLEREIRAQIERFLATGLRLDHVDGHHHLHAHPVVFGALRRSLRGYGVRRVRRMHEDRVSRRPGAPLASGWDPGIHALLARWQGPRAHSPHAADAIPPEARVYGLRASGRIDEDYLLWLIPRLRAPHVELYCHPGRGPGGDREREALCSPRVREAVAEAGYTLVRSGGQPVQDTHAPSESQP